MATVAATYMAVREHAPSLALLSRATVIAAAAAFAVSYGLFQLAAESEGPEAQAFLHMAPGERVAVMTSLPLLIVSVGMFFIIVRWHRMVIRDLPPAATRRGTTSAATLYFGRSFLLGALGIAIVVTCGLLPISLSRELAITDGVRWWIALVCIVGGIVAALLVVGRLSLVLPAGAVGDHHVTLRRSWVLTRGNSVRMLVGSALSSGPAFMINIALNGFLKALPTMSASVPSLVAALVLSFVFFVLAAVFQASFLSLAYKTLTGGGPQIVHTPGVLVR